MEKISREESRQINQKWYFTGLPCKNGHIEKRYVNTEICYACKRERNKRFNDTHKEWLFDFSKKQYEKHRDRNIKSSREWALKNPDKIRAIKRKNKEIHRAKYLEAEKIRNKLRRANDPLWRLNRNMSAAIWKTLRDEKKSQSWVKMVDFDLNELKSHLEKKFRGDMTWDNYGSIWHIDHIKPLSLCSSFEEAWHLQNLQPLTVFENLSKNNRYIG